MNTTNNNYHQIIYSSPTGPLLIKASEIGLLSLFWIKKNKSTDIDIALEFKAIAKDKDKNNDKDKLQMKDGSTENSRVNKILSLTQKELDLYFNNKLTRFSVPLDLSGSRFQLQVWESLQKISYGKTSSYKQIAINIKNPKALRAVGTAIGKNPICIIIPCHRVINSSGAIGGFSGGIEIKKQLLLHENSVY